VFRVSLNLDVPKRWHIALEGWYRGRVVGAALRRNLAERSVYGPRSGELRL